MTPCKRDDGLRAVTVADQVRPTAGVLVIVAPGAAAHAGLSMFPGPAAAVASSPPRAPGARSAPRECRCGLVGAACDHH